jgi:hypothetical protein
MIEHIPYMLIGFFCGVLFLRSNIRGQFKKIGEDGFAGIKVAGVKYIIKRMG